MKPETLSIAQLKKIARSFGCDMDLVHFPDGQGHTYQCGNMVIKRTGNVAESIALAEIMLALPQSEKLRLPTPLKTIDGEWVVDDFVAWTFLSGADLCGNYEEKVAAIDTYNEIFSTVSKPDFMDHRSDGWAVADRVCWGEQVAVYEPVFQNIIDDITPLLEDITLPEQLIHGDISRHILLESGSAPAVIDITPYWRPANFAHAVMMVTDIAWWEGDISDFEFLRERPHWRQLVIRAALRRIIEQPEQIKHIGKDRETAIVRANAYNQALADILEVL